MMTKSEELQIKYHKLLTVLKSDIAAHLPMLRKLAEQSRIVVEYGTRTGVSTTAFLAGQPAELHCFDLVETAEVQWLRDHSCETEFHFTIADTTQVEMPPCDCAFFDTCHNYDQLTAEMKDADCKVRKFMAFHDTQTFGYRNQHRKKPPGADGILPAIFDFLILYPHWKLLHHSLLDNGLMVLQRTNT